MFNSLHRAAQSAEVNWGPLSLVIAAGMPNRCIHPAKRAAVLSANSYTYTVSPDPDPKYSYRYVRYRYLYSFPDPDSMNADQNQISVSGSKL
jgi:hypothetical protein